MDQAKTILFDQPANEHVRICLRIELLREKINNFLAGDEHWDVKNALVSMIELLNLLDRPDLRTKLTKEISRLLGNLRRLQKTPQVDHGKLDQTAHELQEICTSLRRNIGKFAEPLRRNEFIKSITLHHTTPGGICQYNTPGFHVWLRNKPSVCKAQLTTWMTAFQDIFQLTEVLLRLIRESGTFVKQSAESGFIQLPLDPQLPCQLIRINVPLTAQVFPKISLGRHGLSIRFLTLSLSARAQQTQACIDFELATCIF